MKFIQNKIFSQVSEIGIAYSPNAIIINNGKRAAEVMLYTREQQSISVRKLLRGLPHKVLIFTGQGQDEQQKTKIAEVLLWIQQNGNGFFEPIIIDAASWTFDAVAVYTDPGLKAHRAYGLVGGGLCLVRPDQYIAFSCAQFDFVWLEKYLQKVTSW